MSLRPTLAILFACLLASCSDFPDIEASSSPDVLNAKFPKLVPVSDLRDRVASDPTSAREAAAVQAQAGQARVNALKARAARLRKTGLSDDEKNALDRDIAIEASES